MGKQKKDEWHIIIILMASHQTSPLDWIGFLLILYKDVYNYTLWIFISTFHQWHLYFSHCGYSGKEKIDECEIIEIEDYIIFKENEGQSEYSIFIIIL